MEKKRSTNFSTFETNLLIKLVEDKKHVLDPQKLNAASLNMKHGAWREITENFNNHNQIRTYRDEKALKKKYSNLKCDAKNWPALRAEAVMKLSNPESYEMSYQLNRDKADTPSIIINPEPTPENGYMEPQIIDEVPPVQWESTETDASADDTDSSSNRKQPLLLSRNIEQTLTKQAEERMKQIEEDARREMGIMEIEHRHKMNFIHLKHQKAMEGIELQKKMLEREWTFTTGIAFKKKKKGKNGLKKQINRN